MMNVYKQETIFPNNLIYESILDGKVGKFEIKPIQKGFGLTIGNALRRVLLSAIKGCAVTEVNIKGISHEFTIMPHCVQDVSEFLYNLKQVVFTTKQNAILKIEIDGPKMIYASDIILNNGVEILNNDVFLFEISEKGKVEIEIKLEVGVYSKYNKDRRGEIGKILLDANFNPVKNVEFEIRDTRVNDMIDYDNLIMKVTTNGSVSPKDVFFDAVSMLMSFLSSFSGIEKSDFMEERAKNDSQKISNIKNGDSFNYNLVKNVSELELSVRSLNCLEVEGMKYVGDLVKKTENEMLSMPNFGKKSLVEIKSILKDMGLGFGEDIEWPISDIEKKSDEYRRMNV